MTEYLKISDNKIYSFENELTTSEFQDFQNGLLNGTYVRDFVEPESPNALQIAIENEKNSYIHKRKEDGINAFFYLMSELRLLSIANSYPREVNKFIERKLKNVRDEVCLGQWISAREYLDEVIVEGYLTQELYDRVKNTIDTYIATNY